MKKLCDAFVIVIVTPIVLGLMIGMTFNIGMDALEHLWALAQR